MSLSESAPSRNACCSRLQECTLCFKFDLGSLKACKIKQRGLEPRRVDSPCRGRRRRQYIVHLLSLGSQDARHRSRKRHSSCQLGQRQSSTSGDGLDAIVGHVCWVIIVDDACCSRKELKRKVKSREKEKKPSRQHLLFRRLLRPHLSPARVFSCHDMNDIVRIAYFRHHSRRLGACFSLTMAGSGDSNTATRMLLSLSLSQSLRTGKTQREAGDLGDPDADGDHRHSSLSIDS